MHFIDLILQKFKISFESVATIASLQYLLFKQFSYTSSIIALPLMVLSGLP
jgi:hypothetical protein